MFYKKPAVQIKQGSSVLYATTFSVGDLMDPGFYSIHTLDPCDPSLGYQRVLDKRRTKRISGYFSKAWKDGHPPFSGE